MTIETTYKREVFLSKRKQQRLFHLRKWYGFFPPNRACLPGIPRRPDNCKRVIEELCSYYNSFHATKSKNCSILTSKFRKRFYLRFFGEINQQFKVDPRNLKSKHIEWYFTQFINRQRVKGIAHSSIVRAVDNYISMLKFFCLWIGKKGLVRPSSFYTSKIGENLVNAKVPQVRNSFLNPRQTEVLLEKAFHQNELFGMQILCMSAFGLRNREVFGLNPTKCIELKEEEAESKTFGVVHILPKSGSKGGRPRRIALYDSLQAVCGKIIKDYVADRGLTFLRKEGDTLEQAVNTFKFHAKRVGITLSDFNGSAYSLRHSFAQNLSKKLQELSQKDSDELSDNQIHHGVSLSLGHYRPDVTGVYCGSFQPVGTENIKGIIERLNLPSTPIETAKNLLIVWLREFFQQDAKGATFATLWFLAKGHGLNNPKLSGLFTLYEDPRHIVINSSYLAERCAVTFGHSKDMFVNILQRFANTLSEDSVEKQLWTPYISKLPLTA